jgi:hypothetical protein
MAKTRKSARPAIDPILVSIIANRLEAIAEEMAQTLMMTSRSGIFAEARDFVTGIVDADGRLIAQSRYFPGFAGALPYIVPPVRARYEGRLAEGDIIIVNHPYLGNSHLPDMNVMKPVFADGEVRFWVICKGHMADIGGAGVAGYDPLGETIWDEGVIVPPTKLFVRGALQEEVLDLIVSQVKLPEIVRGDILCEVGGVNIGERGLRALFERYGATRVKDHVAAYLRREGDRRRRRQRPAARGAGRRHRAQGPRDLRFQRQRSGQSALYELHRCVHPLDGNLDPVLDPRAQGKQRRLAALFRFRESAGHLRQSEFSPFDRARDLQYRRGDPGGGSTGPGLGRPGQDRGAEHQADLPVDHVHPS